MTAKLEEEKRLKKEADKAEAKRIVLKRRVSKQTSRKAAPRTPIVNGAGANDDGAGVVPPADLARGLTAPILVRYWSPEQAPEEARRQLDVVRKTARTAERRRRDAAASRRRCSRVGVS